MPVFDYKCTRCGSREEHIVLAGEAAPDRCGSCGGDLKRVYGGANVRINLVGWGFSTTDSLIANTRGKDFKALRERADRLRDE